MQCDELRAYLEKRGNLTALADALGISKQAIVQWSEVPHPRVIAVEEFTGIPRHTLRPDLYPRTPTRRSRKAR